MKTIFPIWTIIIIVGISVVSSDVTEQLNAWTRCRGEDVGIQKLAEKVGETLFDCFDQEAKYCLFRCIAINLKIIDSANHLDNHEIDVLARLTKDFKEKERFIAEGKNCAKNKTITTSDKCASMRELIYCTRNKFVEICEIKGEKFKDPNIASEEKTDRSIPEPSVNGTNI